METEEIKYEDIPLPWEGLIIGEESEEVTNRFGGETVTLTPKAVAVYDMIMGAEVMGQWDDHRKGLEWFIKYYPEAYMTLLD